MRCGWVFGCVCGVSCHLSALLVVCLSSLSVWVVLLLVGSAAFHSPFGWCCRPAPPVRWSCLPPPLVAWWALPLPDVSMPLSLFVLKTEIGQFVSIKRPFPLWWQSPHFHLLRLIEVSPFLTVRGPVSFKWLLCLSSFSSGGRPQGKGKTEVENDLDRKIKFCAIEIGKDPERKRMI